MRNVSTRAGRHICPGKHTLDGSVFLSIEPRACRLQYSIPSTVIRRCTNRGRETAAWLRDGSSTRCVAVRRKREEIFTRGKNNSVGRYGVFRRYRDNNERPAISASEEAPSVKSKWLLLVGIAFDPH